MFLRRKRIRVGGKTYEYYAIVENVREGGRVRQKTVVHLGRLDLGDANRVLQWLRGIALLAPGVIVAKDSDVVPDGSVQFAPLVAARAAWDFWRVGEVLKSRVGNDTAELVFVMTANRLVDPGSKHYVSQWFGRTALPGMLSMKPEEVYDERLYRAMDQLLPLKRSVEDAVASRLGEVGQRLDVILYDITSTYFCGRESELIRFGYSRDRRKDRPQVTVGLVTTKDGFPLTHRVYSGNTSDVTTVSSLAREVKERFGTDRAVFVGDRGMMSHDNVKALLRLRYRYILCLRHPKVPGVGEDFWEGLAKHSERDLVVKDVRRGRGRFVIGYNPGKAKQDRERREELLAKARAGLERLAEGAKKGQYKKRSNLLKRATRLLVIMDAERYFNYDVSSRGRPRLHFELNTEEVQRSSRRDGLFVLRTNVLDLPGEEIVRSYKSLERIERAFRTLKSFVKLRPVYHRKDLRIRAHVFICVLAYLLERTLEHWMHGHGVDRTWQDAVAALDTLRWNWIEVGSKRIGRPDRPRPDQIPILEAIGIIKEFDRIQVAEPM